MSAVGVSPADQAGMSSGRIRTVHGTSAAARPNAGDHAFRVRALTEILERIDELSSPSITNGGLPSSERGVMLPPHDPQCRMLAPPPRPDASGRTPPVTAGGLTCTCWRRCVLELERLLYGLQFEKPPWFRAIRLRYLQTERVARRDVKYRAGRWELPANEAVVAMPAGWTLALADARAKHRDRGFVVEVVTVQRWDASVSLRDVAAGVEWLAAGWSQPFEPYLPIVKTSA